MGFEKFVNEHGGVIIAIAAFIVIIGAIVMFGKGEFLVDTFETIVKSFITKAQSEAGF